MSGVSDREVKKWWEWEIEGRKEWKGCVFGDMELECSV